MSLDAQNYEENATELEDGVNYDGVTDSNSERVDTDDPNFNCVDQGSNEDTDESIDMSEIEELAVSAECMSCGYQTEKLKFDWTKQNMRMHLEREHGEVPENFDIQATSWKLLW